MAARALPDHSFPVGRVGERAWGGERPEEGSGCPPRPRPCPRTGHCLPRPQAGRDPRVRPWPARDVAHSQSFGAKVWDEGELADFQELRLPRKTKAQGTDSGFQPLRPHGPGSSASLGV